jgi:hypothetical protein
MVKAAAAMLNVLIVALAGTGKTTCLVQLVRIFAEKLGLSVLCLAFASRDKKALEERCAGKAKVMTSNGAGLSILGAYARQMGNRLDINTDMASQMLQNRLREDGLIKPGKDGERDIWEIGGHIFGAILMLCGKARTCLALKFNSPKFPNRPTDEVLVDLAERFNLELSTEDLPTVLFYAQWLFTEMASLKNMLCYGVDMDGMVFLPVYHNLKPTTQYDRVLIDEGQDQSFVNRMIALSFIRPNTGRAVIVGDPNQAIFSWRMLAEDGLHSWLPDLESKGGFEVFPLTLCRRCAKLPMAEAQKIVPEIQSLPDAPLGSVQDIADSEALFSHLVAKKNGLILCRANAPMISMVLRLLAAGVSAALVRSDIVSGLLRLIDTWSKGKSATPITAILEAKESWLEDQLAKFAKRRNGAAQSQIAQDKSACLTALAQEETVKTAGDLKNKIDRLFPKDTELNPATMVVGSTVHGSKGGEAGDIYLLSPDGYKTNIFDQVWSDARDRDNTLYVALTRCELNLYYVGGRPTMSRFSPAIDLMNLSAEEDNGDDNDE